MPRPPPRPTRTTPGGTGRRRRPERASAVVVCLPGLEDVVASELDALGITSRPAGTGARAARMTTRQLYLANVALASATRVLVDAATVTARGFPALERALADVDLGPWLAPGAPVRFRVTSHRSRLVHTGAVEERLRRLLPVAEPDPEAPDDAALVVVRIDRDRLSLRVDSSGAPLHQRGWRGPAAKAPLRETLAAAALAVSGWRPGMPLVDPFCGSGTIGIEAARRAAGVAPGAGRSFAFERWPSFAPGTWASVRAEVDAPPAAAAAAPILLRDRDAGAVAAARENAERAGVGHLVEVEHGAVSDAAPPAGSGRPGALVTNPPWGGRIGGSGGDLRDLYARLGQVARARFGGWAVAVLVGDERLARATGLGPQVRLRSRAGGHPVQVHVARP